MTTTLHTSEAAAFASHATLVDTTPVPGGRICSSPVARLLARRHGIDLARVRGSGPNGRIVKYDVMLAAAAIGAGAAAVLGVTATRPSESKSAVPHVCLTADCRVDRLVSLRAELNAGRVQQISVNDLVLRAVALALREVPSVNAAWSESALVHFDQIDLALAVATPGGPMTPVIRNAASKSLLSISQEARVLAERARAGQLRAEECLGGSFCVSNLGMYGIDEYFASEHPPQAGSLAVGAVRAQPVVSADGQLTVGKFMRCTLSVDPRAVDGALAAKWLDSFRQLVETPVALLV